MHTKMASVGVIIFSLLLSAATAYKTEEIGLWFGCPGKYLPMRSCQADDATMLVTSVTVYANDNKTALEALTDTKCHLVDGSISRVIHSVDDQGLSEGYDYLYRVIMHHCHGLQTCQVFRLQEWWQLEGHFLANETIGDGLRYFAGVLVDAECRTEYIPRWPVPPSTTTTTAMPTTSGFSVTFEIYQSRLSRDEKIALAAVIGVSVLVLLVLLLLLHNWDRYHRKLKIAVIFDDLGKPHEEHDWYEKELCAETERDFYSDSKPDEIVTLDRRTLKADKLWVEEDNISQHSHNSCSTMGRRRKQGCDNKSFKYSAEVNELHVPLAGVPSIKVTPPNYDTAENLELERRMAENLAYTESVENTDRSSLSSQSQGEQSTGTVSESDVFIVGKKSDYDLTGTSPSLEKIHTERSNTIWRVEAKFKHIGSHSLSHNVQRHVVQPFSYKCEVKVTHDREIKADVQRY